MKEYILVFLVFGFVGLTMPLLIPALKRVPYNYSMLSLLFGFAVYALPVPLPEPDPEKHEDILLRLSELAVIISLMGAGLKIDSRFSLRKFSIPLLLVFITMILCIAAVTFGGVWLLGLSLPSALLLGAVFSPTDPVLADEVQVGIHEKEHEEHPVRFALTAEAGLNDGMAFPFTWLAVSVASYGLNWITIGEWAAWDLLYRVVAGVVVGIIMGRVVAWLLFRLPGYIGHDFIRMDFVIIAITLLIYGITEAVQGYGFIAVFVGGYTLRHFDREEKFHLAMYDFVAQIEKVFIAVFMILLGGYFHEHHFSHLSFEAVLLALAFIFIIRPITGLPALIGSPLTGRQRLIVSFMGIKGIGSVFYLAFAFHITPFLHQTELWEMVALLILASVFIHGLTAHLIRRHLGIKDKPGSTS